MTPFTSFLALESEAAYAQMGVTRKSSRLRPARLASLNEGAEASAPNPSAILPLFVGCDSQQSSDKATSRGPAPEEAKTPDKSEGQAPTGALNEPVASPAVAADLAPPAAQVKAAPTKLAARTQAGGQELKDSFQRSAPDAELAFAFGGPGGAARARANHTSSPAALAGKQKQVSGAEQSTLAEPRVTVSKVALGTCSDLSKRALSDRVVFWYRRLLTAENAQDLMERYSTAKRSCELSDWLAERTFLGLLESRLTNEGDARQILSHFSDQPDVRNFIASRLLRRSTDARIIVAVREVLFGNAVDWLAVDRTIQGMGDPEKRIAELRKAIARAPTDPEGNLRLLRQLARAGHTAEALALGQRSKDTGLFTPELVRRVGDLLTRDRQTEQAQRVYSELVEFAPDDRSARQMLGDIYLANHWFDPAYRQYQLLTDLSPDVPLFWLRLASAAAGAGRTDEALRIERRVSAAEGTPGPTDPRRYARLLATNQLATLYDTQKSSTDPTASHRADAISRDIKEFNLFSSAGRLIIATWLDPMTDLLLTMLDDKDAAGIGELTDAAIVGLQAAWLNAADAGHTHVHLIRRSSLSEQPLDIALSVIDWDGRNFHVERRTLVLPADATFIDG